jgi:hypothetical protein
MLSGTLATATVLVEWVASANFRRPVDSRMIGFPWLAAASTDIVSQFFEVVLLDV